MDLIKDNFSDAGLTFSPAADGSQNGLVYTPVAGEPQSFVTATECCPSLTFHVGGNKPIMTFHPDGRVTADPDMDADEAARKIIDIIIQQWPAILARRV